MSLKHNVLSDNYNSFEYNISKHFENWLLILFSLSQKNLTTIASCFLVEMSVLSLIIIENEVHLSTASNSFRNRLANTFLIMLLVLVCLQLNSDAILESRKALGRRSGGDPLPERKYYVQR